MIHQPLGGAQGQAADIEIQANEILHHKLTLNGYLAEFTNQGMERITQDTGQDHAHGTTCCQRHAGQSCGTLQSSHVVAQLLQCLTQRLRSCVCAWCTLPKFGHCCVTREIELCATSLRTMLNWLLNCMFPPLLLLELELLVLARGLCLTQARQYTPE